MFNTTGPPAVLYVSGQDWQKTSIVASLNFFIFMASIMVFVLHLVGGNFTRDIFSTFVLLIPVMLAGRLLEYGATRGSAGEKYRKSLYAVLIIIGALLVY